MFKKIDSECGRFSWDEFRKGDIYDKVASRTIYRMSYLNEKGQMSEKVSDDTKTLVLKFLEEINTIQELDAIEKEYKKNAKIEAENAPNIPELLKNKSFEEIKALENKYDAIHNEGAQGFNPYRDFI